MRAILETAVAPRGTVAARHRIVGDRPDVRAHQRRWRASCATSRYPARRAATFRMILLDITKVCEAMKAGAEPFCPRLARCPGRGDAVLVEHHRRRTDLRHRHAARGQALAQSGRRAGRRAGAIRGENPAHRYRGGTALWRSRRHGARGKKGLSDARRIHRRDRPQRAASRDTGAFMVAGLVLIDPWKEGL